jgi:hypothetical protein
MNMITAITDETLFQILKLLKLNPGPIVPSTRKVYERKLVRYLTGGTIINVNGGTVSDKNDSAFSEYDL